jgi:hypothetical protein
LHGIEIGGIMGLWENGSVGKWDSPAGFHSENAMSKSMTRKTDLRARVTLFEDFADSLVNVERVSANEVRVYKIKPKRRKYTMKELLENVTLENRHDEVDFGRPVGKEIW